MEGILFPQLSISTFDWLTSVKVEVEYKMICDWLANWEYLFPRGPSIKMHVFRVRREKISDVHAKNRRIRKAISQRTEASPAKASFSENLSYRERLHQPDTSFVCLSNTTKVTQFSHTHIYIYILLHNCVLIDSC